MPRALSRGALAILLVVFAAAWFGTLDARRLLKADEGRYAEIAREMVVNHDWVTPRLNDYKYFEKPPLQYWATAVAYELFGVNEWTARLWTALTGFLAVLATALAAQRLYGSPAGLYAGAVAGSSLLLVTMAHLSSLDMGVSFFLAAGVFAFALAQRDAATAVERRNGMLIAWACAALATLSKGLIGIVLPAGAIGAYVLLQRDWRLLARMHWVSGLVLAAIIAVPWFVLASRANPEFAHFFFIHEHFQRFLTKEHGRYGPPWYFVPVLLVGFVPWTLLLVPAVRDAWRAESDARFRPSRFLLVWSAVVFVFFSASSSKLQSYILPIVPALAALAGGAIARGHRGWLKAQAMVTIAGGIAVAVLSRPILMQDADEFTPPALYMAFTAWVIAAGIVLAAGGLAAWLALRREAITASVLSLAAAGLVAVQLAMLGHDALSPSLSAYHIVQQIKGRLPADARFFIVNNFDHTLPFYLGRPVTMVAYKDELAAPIEWEPQKFIADYPAFERAWNEAPAAYALMHPRDYAVFKQVGFPMKEVARDPRRVIVTRP